MFDKVNILLDSIPPFRLCALLDIPVTAVGRACVITDPKTLSEMYITDLDFIPKQMDSNFIGGNIVDFCRHVKEISYSETIDYLIKEYCVASDNPALQAIVWAKNSICEYFEDLHLINSELLTFKELEDCKARSECVLFLHKYDLSHRVAQKLVSIRTGSTIKNTLSRIKSATINSAVPLADAVGYVVIPYYSSHYMPTAIDFYNPLADSVTTVTITPHKHAFFGLRSARPTGVGPTILSDWKHLMESYGTYLKHGDLMSGCVAIKNFPAGTVEGPKLSRGLLPVNRTNITLRKITNA